MNVLLGLIFFWEFGWFWLRLEIIKFGFFLFFILKWFWLVEIKNNKIVTKMPRNMFNRCQETWPIRMNMFKCLYNFPENVDKNMKLWTNISSLFMNIHEHSSQPRKCGQLFFKFGQYCPHFLENSMNIRVYAWTFKWTQKVWTIFLSIISCFCPHFLENCINISGFT